MDPTFIMLMIALAQLIIVQAILARQIFEELFNMEPDQTPARFQVGTATKRLRHSVASHKPPPAFVRCSGADSVTIL